MEEKIQRLSEGMDFIEEATSWTNESLSFQEPSEVVLSESKGSTKSPYKILGKACGCFAPIGEFSRNKRLYSDDLWPTVLANEEFSSRLAHRAVFGCISHEDKLVDDVDIREGKVSHIVTKLEIREDLNNKPYLYGELEILDTPAGRILEAMYKGGADLYVSSRAAGKLIPVPGQNYSLVRPEQYHVHCFDVVCRPGFLQARPAFEAASVEPVKHEVSESAPITTSDACITTAPVVTPVVNENSEVAELKGQIDKLAKIIEKVVDDVYEVDETSVEENKTPEPAVEAAPTEPQISEAMEDFLKLLSETNITDEAVSDIFDIMFNKKEENK